MGLVLDRVWSSVSVLILVLLISKACLIDENSTEFTVAFTDNTQNRENTGKGAKGGNREWREGREQRGGRKQNGGKVG